MKIRKLPKPPKKFTVKLFYLLYARKRLKKFRLIDDGSLAKIKPPYLLLANHSSFADVLSITSMLLPNVACYIASQTQYARFGSILNSLGILAKKQFVVSPTLIKDIKHILSKGCPVVLYPEAKLSVDGTPNVIKPSAAKLAKMLKVPLVTVCFSGSYLHKPRWSIDSRSVPVVADVKLAATSEQLANMSVEQIHNRIVENLSYDDYAYQLAENIEITSKTLACGLDGILYICPQCKKKFGMTAQANTIVCTHCNYCSTMDSLGRLCGKFDSVKSWYAFEHQQVRLEIEKGEYCIDTQCRVQKQTKSKFVKVKGVCRFVHNDKGIFVTLPSGEQLDFARGRFYTMSFDNDYLFLPTENAVLRLSFSDRGLPCHINIAVEEYDKLDSQR